MNKIRHDISMSAVFKIILTALLVVAVYQLMTLLTLMLLGIFLAVTMNPLVVRLEERGLPRNIGVSLLGLGIGLVLTLTLLTVIPEVSNQLNNLTQDFPKIQASLNEYLPASGPFRKFLNPATEHPGWTDPQSLIGHALLIANKTLEGVSEFFLVLIFSIYFLFDRGRSFQWFQDFFSQENRKKINKTAVETAEIIHGYVIAQVVTSVLCAIYVSVTMSLLGVPGALVLGVLAGIFDVVPILGFFISIAPALLLALTISPTAVLITLVLYLIYHALENYVIVPYIYGGRMKVSPLVVLVALLCAGILGGVLGAIVILPIVASYPIIERIWLGEMLGQKVIEKHQAEEESAKV